MIKNERSHSLLNHYAVFALEFLLFLKHIEPFPTSRPPRTSSRLEPSHNGSPLGGPVHQGSAQVSPPPRSPPCGHDVI